MTFIGNNKSLSAKQEGITAYIVLAVCSIVFISLCFNNNVWLDEAFTASLVNTDMAGVLQRSMADTLPPLYNILLKLTTMIFGYKIPVMKITSVVPMIATMFLGVTTVRKRFGLKTSLLFMICIAGMPHMLNYGIEIRMYSLGFFFATASGIYAYELLCDFNRKNCIIFSLMSVLAGYSHHFAFVAVGFVFLFLLIYYFFADRKNIKRWFICLGITIGLYIPCMIVTLKQLKSVSGYFSMPDITVSLFIQYVVYPFMTGNTIVSALLMLCVLLLAATCIYSIIRKPEIRNISVYAICCLLVYYGVLMFGTLISKIMTANIFVDRYLFFSMGMIWLFFAVIAGNVEEYLSFKKADVNSVSDTTDKAANNAEKAAGIAEKITVVSSVIIFIIAISALVTTYAGQFKEEYSASADEELQFMEENFNEGDIFYTIEYHEELQFCIPFYTGLLGMDDFTYEPLMDMALKDLDEKGGTLWIVVQDGYDISEEEYKMLQDARLEPYYATTFEFDRYKCDIYKAVSR